MVPSCMSAMMSMSTGSRTCLPEHGICRSVISGPLYNLWSNSVLFIFSLSSVQTSTNTKILTSSFCSCKPEHARGYRTFNAHVYQNEIYSVTDGNVFGLVCACLYKICTVDSFLI